MFFNETATTDIYPFVHSRSLRVALPISSTASRPWWRKPDRSGMQRSVRLDRRGDVLFGRKPVFADRFRESALHLVDLSGRQVTRKDPEHHHRRVRRIDRTTIAEANRKSTRLNSSH